jgi:hypothetical protein
MLRIMLRLVRASLWLLHLRFGAVRIANYPSRSFAILSKHLIDKHDGHA